MLEIREGRCMANNLIEAITAVEDRPEKEITWVGGDFVIISRENYYKLKEYEATCSGLL